MTRRTVVLAMFLLGTIWTASLGAQVKTTTATTATKSKKVNIKAVDINSASETDMAPLGIDAATAKKIIAGRPYRNKRDLVSKQLITADQYNKIKNLIVARSQKNG